MATIDEVLLTDLAHNKDFVVTAGGDLATLSGIANFRDALFARLVTTPGSLVHRPEYGVGIKQFQNVLNRISTQRTLATRIGENFGRDPRVEQVLGVLVDYNEQNPAQTTIKVRVKPIGVDPVQMDFLPFNEA